MRHSIASSYSSKTSPKRCILQLFVYHSYAYVLYIRFKLKRYPKVGANFLNIFRHIPVVWEAQNLEH